MPIHLTSRRQFITQLGAAAALSSVESIAAEVDESLIAILNDTHIGGQHPASASIPTNLRNTISYLLAMPKRPAAVIINGDLALKDGQRGDYEHFAKLIAPLRDAGVPLHLTMGNHDDREVFYDVLKSDKPESPAVESKHVGVVKLAGANLFLLDSLKATMVTQGLLGETRASLRKVWVFAIGWCIALGTFALTADYAFAVVLLFAADRVFRFQAVLPIMTPVLLIGGMTTGVFTPTEGAIAACVWAIVLGFFWYRTLNFKMFVKICLDTVETTSTVLFIVAAASIFGWMLTATGVTTAIGQWVLGFTSEPWMFLLLANLLMLFVGCFLEPTAAITILVPILVPICQQLGIDLVHFGLVMVLNLMIGLLHPPMGMVLFVLARVAKLSVERTTMAILPWLFPLLGSLVVITYVPSLVLWLPKQFY